MKYLSNKKKNFIYYVSFFIFFSNNAYAYLDPGSINIFLQIAAGLLSALFLFVGSVNTFIKYVLERHKFKEIEKSTVLNQKDFERAKETIKFIKANKWNSALKSVKKVKDSVLLIYADNESTQVNLRSEIAQRGINPNRLIFGKHLPKDEYLARYLTADLFLDTHPFNAGTTASDSLRMGLPVLTLEGKSFNSREASSILSALNLPELITATREEYESVAVKLATHPEKLKIIKTKLLNNLTSAPLYNSTMFTRHLESAYSIMYDRFQQGCELDHIYVKKLEVK